MTDLAPPPTESRHRGPAPSPAAPATAGSRSPERAAKGLALLWRVFLLDAALLIVATVVLAATPITVSSPPAFGEVMVLLGGLAAMLVLTLALLRRSLRPLDALTATMRRIDPLAPGQRVSIPRSDANVRALSRAFNEMLDRLETERRESARTALMAQENERRRVAQELHDEVGQTLTAMLLQIESLSAEIPPQLAEELDELRESTRVGADEVRRIARRLRPEALEELGLHSALAALARRVCDQAGLPVDCRIEPDLPSLTREQELVVYRVAQEALTNVVRHAGASRAELVFGRLDGGVLLSVADDGRGAPPEARRSARGIRGMRERALLVGARLTIDTPAGGGTRVALALPVAPPA